VTVIFTAEHLVEAQLNFSTYSTTLIINLQEKLSYREIASRMLYCQVN